MYHRFEENKYPSTNIKIADFKSHINIIKELNFEFISHKQFKSYIDKKDNKKKILLTIDDGFSSFYKNAWPVLKKNKIPFIIFINTESIGSNGYMSWEEIKEISEFDFVHIGNHSHTHDYLVDKTDQEIKEDIITSIKIFQKKLNHKTEFFAYPFGEYRLSYKKIVKDLGFNFGFGQHSGVMDSTKDKFALQGNAMFGQWTYGKDGIKPKDSEGLSHKVLKFPMLRSSIVAYQRNLNTHKAYSTFRENRAKLREANKKISGLDLVDYIESYAATGKEYVKILRNIITQNKLTDFDNSVLMNTSNERSLAL